MSAYTFSTSPVYYAVYKIIEPNQCNTVLKHYTIPTYVFGDVLYMCLFFADVVEDKLV